MSKKSQGNVREENEDAFHPAKLSKALPPWKIFYGRPRSQVSALTTAETICILGVLKNRHTSLRWV